MRIHFAGQYAFAFFPTERTHSPVKATDAGKQIDEFYFHDKSLDVIR
jgi:hypothetical protein